MLVVAERCVGGLHPPYGIAVSGLRALRIGGIRAAACCVDKKLGKMFNIEHARPAGHHS